ncbi:hypothetical protein SAMN04515647_0312 [Cohaesibacter sp. ES.047]|uniref:HAD family hydrolase n=1 Tax=Cohaesibacter sp. ES.047 TaxID=1798205 RepID=UPI000BB73E5E|nr:HAD family hydrolase [Cohaesibacter sp. ES.047]SNY90165.1 hypothetical protein SAMN04515647_0312 [Cohaesibacter sp. ES.047]
MTSSTRCAIIYDFDGTLAKGNLQETSFIPEVGLTKEEFWSEVKSRTKANDADEILVYMQLMLELSASNNKPLTKSMLSNHGQAAQLFPGLSDKTWFKRINQHAKKLNLSLEHYIISSGIDEMIDGCSIRDCFTKIFASKFIYESEKAVWPGAGINYTTKTQYLFRINKGINNHWDNTTINSYIPEPERPIPFEHMVFLGDGDTDIPTMKMLTYKGGNSIAVYDESKNSRDLDKIHTLISDGRVNFIAPANYKEHSSLDIIVKGIIGRIARQQGYRP